MVKGYSKATEYLPGDEFVDNTYRNSWNTVFVAGGWRLVQANWGMMSVNNKVGSHQQDLFLGITQPILYITVVEGDAADLPGPLLPHRPGQVHLRVLPHGPEVAADGADDHHPGV